LAESDEGERQDLEAEDARPERLVGASRRASAGSFSGLEPRALPWAVVFHPVGVDSMIQDPPSPIHHLSNHGDVAEKIPTFVPGLEAAGGVGDFVADAGELSEGRAGAGDAAAFGLDHRDVVDVRRFYVHELAAEVAGELEDFSGVAVVEAENGSSSCGLDAHAREAEIEASGCPADRLSIVVELDFGVGGRQDATVRFRSRAIGDPRHAWIRGLIRR